MGNHRRLLPTPLSQKQSLSIGDPREDISVPTIHSIEQKRKRDLFLPGGKRGTVTQMVLVRTMTREHHLKHYAKDAQGNYISTERPAPDAGLMFVPGKNTDLELLEQVRKAASGVEHSNRYHMNGWAATQAGGGAF
ncbi:hypothetical protein G6011_07946 [Alternaria panax]|uniref:Uncharacterized protein n=1 Tax=Alternaria panax TaxID=48097 RepID=A0AAD4F920_9PLEO|nr:hypothetical protein G6011_07946 [Alternaria panax]